MMNKEEELARRVLKRDEANLAVAKASKCRSLSQISSLMISKTNNRNDFSLSRHPLLASYISMDPSERAKGVHQSSISLPREASLRLE